MQQERYKRRLASAVGETIDQSWTQRMESSHTRKIIRAHTLVRSYSGLCAIFKMRATLRG